MKNISTDPYWWSAAPPQDFEMDSWPTRADVVIIGGGYTGFGAAIPLARTGLDVVILERDQIGSGASTRNGGIPSGKLRVSLDKLTKKFGKEKYLNTGNSLLLPIANKIPIGKQKIIANLKKVYLFY